MEKDCNENDLKRAYKKLALEMHPDKNRTPGATEAFKGELFSDRTLMSCTTDGVLIHIKHVPFSQTL